LLTTKSTKVTKKNRKIYLKLNHLDFTDKILCVLAFVRSCFFLRALRALRGEINLYLWKLKSTIKLDEPY